MAKQVLSGSHQADTSKQSQITEGTNSPASFWTLTLENKYCGTDWSIQINEFLVEILIRTWNIILHCEGHIGKS